MAAKGTSDSLSSLDDASRRVTLVVDIVPATSLLETNTGPLRRTRNVWVCYFALGNPAGARMAPAYLI